MKKILKSVVEKCKEVLSKKFRQDNPKVTYIIIAVIAFIIVATSIHLFLELTENLKAKYMNNIDASVSQYVISFRTPALTKYFTFATNLGGSLGYLCMFVICTLVFYLIFHSWKFVIELALISLLALSSNVVLKQIIHRARPLSEHLVTVKTLSYPSGHAMSAMAFYGFLIYLFYTFK
jgi:undecaprenyl-diphosphatase